MSYLHERAGDNALIEYRRNPVVREGILDLQSRALRPDGTPHGEEWFTVSDANLLHLQQCGSDIVELLARRL